MQNKTKKFLRSILAGGLSVALLCVVFVVPVSAESFRTFNDHKFEQGINNVDCLNAINIDEYPELYAAVAAAIRDWDWHLGLLNQQHGVNWNLETFSGDRTQTVPMIEFVDITNEEFKNSHNQLDPSYLDDVAYTEHYGNNQGTFRNRLSPIDFNWYSVTIYFFVDVIEDNGDIHDYYELKNIANHEIGHALGLRHYSDDLGVLMYPTQARTADVATAADLEGVYYLYG